MNSQDEKVFLTAWARDMLSSAGGFELAMTMHVKTTWKKSKELLPVLSSCHLSYKTLGRVYSSCVRNAMLHASQTFGP